MFRYPHYNEPYLKQVRQSSLSPFQWKYKQIFTSFKFLLAHYRLSVILRRFLAFENAKNAHLQLFKTQIFLSTRYNEPHYNELFVWKVVPKWFVITELWL